jgi:dCMP deaminase
MTLITSRWDEHFFRETLEQASMSKDPSTRVGAVAVRTIGGRHFQVASGFNGFPQGIADTPDRLNDRPTKMRLIVHAEENVIADAALRGVSLAGCRLYLSATDDSGLVWGGAPCTHCTLLIIQAGIVEIVSRPVKATPSRWHDDLAYAGTLLDEAGVIYREVPLP